MMVMTTTSTTTAAASSTITTTQTQMHQMHEILKHELEGAGLERRQLMHAREQVDLDAVGQIYVRLNIRCAFVD